MNKINYIRRPPWLRIRLPGRGEFYRVKSLVREKNLNTVCQSARCPNLGECWGRRTATFLIMGNVCSRNCGFCAVHSGKPVPLDNNEPIRVAEAVGELKLKYAVVTSVSRDDLRDGGADHFAKIIAAIRDKVPGCKIEVLIPDFQGDSDSLRKVMDAGPDVINHNLETVKRLYKTVRPQAVYSRSLRLLKRAREHGVITKSGFMLGLGEKIDEVKEAMWRLRKVDCQILTLGQYLQPSREHLPVGRFVPPEEFEKLRLDGLEMGFVHVEAAPLVRSSYHAAEQLEKSGEAVPPTDAVGL